jgi:hypothetical protein
MDERDIQADKTVEADDTKILTSTIDRSIVLSSIDGRLSEIKAAWREKHPDANPNKEAFYFQCMDLNALQTRYLSLDEIDEDEESTASSSEQEQDISFDDADILDTEAYEKVIELRAKSREIAGRVIQTREQAIEKALGVTGRSVEELIRVHGFEGAGDEEGHNTDMVGEEDDNGRIAEPLNAALRNLTSSLRNVDSNLSQKLDSIKETIGTIDSAVEKYTRISQGEENVLSQTEKAIIAASRVKMRKVEEKVMGEETLNDSDRNLARLLAGAL